MDAPENRDIPRIWTAGAMALTVQGQCNDACATTLSRSVSHTSGRPRINAAYAPALRQVTCPLPGPHQAVLTPASASSVAVLNTLSARLLSAFEGGRTVDHILSHPLPGVPVTASRTAIEEMIRLGLLVPVGVDTRLPPETPSTLNAWLHVTNACNLDCAYCYVAKSAEDMSPEVGRQAVDAVLRAATRHGFHNEVLLKYAGGEPSLRLSLVQELQAYARSRADGLGIRLEAVLLTNGVGLGDRALATLLTQNIGLAVSLDGLGDSHDAQRGHPSGRGTARSVQHTLKRAQSMGLIPDVTITITGRNLDGLPQTVAWLLEHDLPFALNFYREHDRSTGQIDLSLRDEELIEGVRRAFRVIKANPPRYGLLNCLLDRVRMGAAHHYPCAAAHNYLVIDHKGRVAQCQMAMERPVSSIWTDDPLAEVQSAPDGIPGLSVDVKEDCALCEWRYWCAGGCPLQARRVSGRWDVPSPLCSVYRALMPDLLRLEGLRLLKQARCPDATPYS